MVSILTVREFDLYMANILVVEDDPQFNQIVCIYLNNHGQSAQGVLSVQDAYDKMYNQLFDLIISDIMLPKMSVKSIQESQFCLSPRATTFNPNDVAMNLGLTITWSNQLTWRNC